MPLDVNSPIQTVIDTVKTLAGDQLLDDFKTDMANAINAAEAENTDLLVAQRVDLADSIGAPTAVNDGFGQMALNIDAVKAKLAPKVGGLATDSLDSLADKAVTTSEVMKFASGTAVTTAAESYTYGDSSGTSSAYGVEVTGLSFKPKRIILMDRRAATVVFMTVYDETPLSPTYADWKITSNELILSTGSRLAKGYRLTGPARVDNTSFKLPIMSVTGSTVDWIALG